MNLQVCEWGVYYVFWNGLLSESSSRMKVAYKRYSVVDYCQAFCREFRCGTDQNLIVLHRHSSIAI